MTETQLENDIADCWQQIGSSATRPVLWLSLGESYAERGLHWQASYAARQAIRLGGKLTERLRALQVVESQGAAEGDAALSRRRLSEVPTIAKRYFEHVARCPGDWLTWLYLARLCEMHEPIFATQSFGQEFALPQAAQNALTEALNLEPFAGESLHWMGVWRLNAGDDAGAVAALSKLIDIRPVRYGSMMFLGDALLRAGNVAAAEKAFARASLSDNPDFLLALSARVYGHNYWQEAIAVLNKALSIRPNSVQHWLALAKIQSEVYQLGDCRESLRRAIGLEPANPEARLLQAGLQGRMGDARGHLASLQDAYVSQGDPLSRTASSIAMTLLYQDDISPVEVAERHMELCRPIEAAVRRQTDFKAAIHAKTSARRLRIGYVTGDLHRQHPVNIFILPVLLRHDHVKLEINVYHSGLMHDEYTRQAKASADRWTETAGMDDSALHQAIVDDEIDILIDLAGHTSSHRLGVFAMRAAPVQATFLGYPHSTGLSSIDWLIGDPVVSPSDHGHLFSEGIAQLPGSVFCWAPVDDYPLPSPRKPADPITFGSFNNAMKLSPKTISIWAQVLHAVPGALLLLKAPAMRDEAVQSRFSEMFGERGIARQRLIFRGPSELSQMMQEYGDIDIALDPTPYNGGTTTLQALWMGVPVVGLRGGNFVSRMAASFMTTLGQPAWVAASDAQYVETAARLAGEAKTFRGRRKHLREQMAASPLCDIDDYVRQFEDLMHRMWLAYCKGEHKRVIGPATPTLRT